MKFLTICKHGNVRSVAMAYLLHDKHGVEALPIGIRKVSPATATMMIEWADVVVLMDDGLRQYLPLGVEISSKLVVVHVGRDRWGYRRIGALIDGLAPAVAAWSAAGFPRDAFPTGDLTL